MKFLLDMGISPRTAEYLRGRGHDAVHLGEENLGTLPDPAILEKARSEQRVLLTHDLDFPDLLAASSARLPSVVVFRLRVMRPENVNRSLASVLDHHGAALEEGAVLTVTEGQIRHRPLPIAQS